MARKRASKSRKTGLGTSNDEHSNVQEEIEAAMLQVQPFFSTFHPDGWESHHLGHLADYDPPDDVGIGWRAGWLAREISTHESRSIRDEDAWPWDPARPVAGQYEEFLAISDQTRHDVAASVVRHADLEQRIESGIAKLGADLAPPLGYEDRVLAAVTPHDPTGSPLVFPGDPALHQPFDAADRAAFERPFDAAARERAWNTPTMQEQEDDRELDALEFEAQRAAEPDPQDDDGSACGNCVNPGGCAGACESAESGGGLTGVDTDLGDADDIPTRLVVDEATFAEITDAIENPRPPTEAIRRLMHGVAVINPTVEQVAASIAGAPAPIESRVTGLLAGPITEQDVSASRWPTPTPAEIAADLATTTSHALAESRVTSADLETALEMALGEIYESGGVVPTNAQGADAIAAGMATVLGVAPHSIAVSFDNDEVAIAVGDATFRRPRVVAIQSGDG